MISILRWYIRRHEGMTWEGQYLGHLTYLCVLGWTYHVSHVLYITPCGHGMGGSVLGTPYISLCFRMDLPCLSWMLYITPWGHGMGGSVLGTPYISLCFRMDLPCLSWDDSTVRVGSDRGRPLQENLVVSRSRYCHIVGRWKRNILFVSESVI